MKPFRVILPIAALALTAPGIALSAGADDPLLTMLNVEQLEWRDANEGDVMAWGAQGWVGYDLDKFWFKSEGEQLEGDTEAAELQLLYGRAIDPNWDLQLGLRYDFEPEDNQKWLTLGVQGLAPYYIETELSLFVGEEGQNLLRLEAEYELMLTQRLVLSPELEMSIYSDDDESREIGSGLSSMELGLRLAYEVKREFAPYIGINWEKKFGNTADFAKEEGEDTDDLQFVAGVRFWF